MTDDVEKSRKGRDPIFSVCFVVFILTAAVLCGATIYDNYIEDDRATAAVGSSLSVNYTLTFYDYYGEEFAVVNDTSYESIGNNDAIAKSNDFTVKTSYSELTFSVGSGSTVLAGFGNAVIGHKEGDTVKVMIPAGEGYNAEDTNTVYSCTEAQAVAISETLTLTQFSTIYGYTPSGTVTIDESVYGWPAVGYVNTTDSTIVMNYNPTEGETYEVKLDYGTVTFTVGSVEDGMIEFTYGVKDFTATGNKLASGYDEIQMILVDFGTSSFYITGVDSTGDVSSFQSKTVEERYNQDLYFVIKIVSVD